MCGFLSGGPGAAPAAMEGTMFDYQIQPLRQRIFAGEAMPLRMTIANRSTEPLAIPDPARSTSVQPRHRLVGPGIEAGIELGNAGPVKPDTSPAAAPPQTLRTIAPGEKWERVFRLTDLVPLTQPGRYQMVSRLTWGLVDESSPVVSFEVTPLDLQAVALGGGRRPSVRAQGELAFVHQDGVQFRLYSASFRETDRLLPESPILRHSAERAIEQVLLPQRNGPYFAESLRWLVWREGAVLKALHSALVEPAMLDLPSADDRLVEPALQTMGGPVELLSWSASQRQIALLRLSVTGTPPQRRVETGVAWRQPLPLEADDRVVGLRAALPADEASSQRHLVVLVHRKSGQLELLHAIVDPAQGLGPFRSSRLDADGVVDPASLTLHVGRDGVARVTLVTLRESGADAAHRRFDAVAHERVLAPDGAANTSGWTAVSLGSHAARPRGFGVCYVESEGRLMRRDIVLQAADGSLRKLGAAGQVVALRTRLLPAFPLQLVPSDRQTFIVLQDPARGLVFDAI